jgi:hypothetical protein
VHTIKSQQTNKHTHSLSYLMRTDECAGSRTVCESLRYGGRDLVVSIGDGKVLHHVARVKYIWRAGERESSADEAARAYRCAWAGQ